jgi:hypothetical protein
VGWTGSRVEEDFVSDRGRYRIPREERLRDYAHVQVGPVSRYHWKVGAEGLTPVCVELTPGAQDLTWFEHPEHALYVFGPEDGGLSAGVKVQCHRFVQIPTLEDRTGRSLCLNLAAAVNIVLYDRLAKMQTRERSPTAEAPTSGVGG